MYSTSFKPDEDECEDKELYCGKNAVCYNTNGSYYCQCETGYQELSGKVNFTLENTKGCKDINECLEITEICGPNSKCNNTPGSYFCSCKDRFILSNGQKKFNASQGVTCDDVCTIDESLCGEGDCIKSEDGHECVCKAGFTNYGFKTMKCTRPNCRFLTENISVQLRHDPEHVPPELQPVIEELRSRCLKLSGDPDMRRMWMVDGNTLFERFLNALDELLSAGPLNSNKKVTAVLETTENVLKLLGPLLSNITKSNVDTGFAAASLLSYNGLESSVNDYFDHIRTQENETLKINSKVVTAMVTNPDTTQLRKRIILTFSHLQQPSDGNQMCVFWDPSLDGGAWSTKGCTVVSSNANHTVCSCTHLSSFAVLMALHEMQEVFELQLIAWVGLSLSLISLLICILTFGFIRSIQSTRTTIHLHLCISLFIANLVFLAGISRMENKVGCAFVAGLLHFFFLVALCWMCLEGVQLFNTVVLVFNTMLRPLYLMVGGYGVPVLIVIISASINARGYGTKHHCWPNLKGGFIWIFFGPVCVIICVNVFFFLITVWKLVQKISLLKQDLSKLQKIKSFTVTAIAQLCVLGTMWIFGCFQLERGSLVMSYLFTIFLSLQGVLVFVMHCLLSKQVREEYARILTSLCAQKKKSSEFSTNQSSKSQLYRHPGVSSTRESQTYEAGWIRPPAALSMCTIDLVCSPSDHCGS
ncbi:hypothetical protein MHYP_G00305100 [Metynnis hypsauchen]